jgi:hypothetical protein
VGFLFCYSKHFLVPLLLFDARSPLLYVSLAALVVVTLKNFSERRKLWAAKEQEQMERMGTMCDNVELVQLLANGRDESTLTGYYRGPA